MKQEKITAALTERTGVPSSDLDRLLPERLNHYFAASAAPPDNEVVLKLAVFLGALPCAQGDWMVGFPLISFAVGLALKSRERENTNAALADAIRKEIDSPSAKTIIHSLPA